jgi:hypothetical protein
MEMEDKEKYWPFTGTSTGSGSGISDLDLDKKMKNSDKHNDELIGMRVSINDIEWRVADKAFRFGREWQYTLSHENIDGTYESMQLNETALLQIIESGSRTIELMHRPILKPND